MAVTGRRCTACDCSPKNREGKETFGGDFVRIIVNFYNLADIIKDLAALISL